MGSEFEYREQTVSPYYHVASRDHPDSFIFLTISKIMMKKISYLQHALLIIKSYMHSFQMLKSFKL